MPQPLFRLAPDDRPREPRQPYFLSSRTLDQDQRVVLDPPNRELPVAAVEGDGFHFGNHHPPAELPMREVRRTAGGAERGEPEVIKLQLLRNYCVAFTHRCPENARVIPL